MSSHYKNDSHRCVHGRAMFFSVNEEFIFPLTLSTSTPCCLCQWRPRSHKQLLDQWWIATKRVIPIQIVLQVKWVLGVVRINWSSLGSYVGKRFLGYILPPQKNSLPEGKKSIHQKNAPPFRNYRNLSPLRVGCLLLYDWTIEILQNSGCWNR